MDSDAAYLKFFIFLLGKCGNLKKSGFNSLRVLCLVDELSPGIPAPPKPKIRNKNSTFNQLKKTIYQ